MKMELASGDEPLDIQEVCARLNRQVPAGLKFTPSVDASLKSAEPSAMMFTEYRAFLKASPVDKGGFEDIDGFIREFKAKESCIIQVIKEDKVTQVDIKPSVADIADAGDGSVRFVLRKGVGPQVRPHDALAALFNLSKQDASLIPVLKMKSFN